MYMYKYMVDCCFNNQCLISKHTYSVSAKKKYPHRPHTLTGGCSSSGLSQDELEASLATLESLAVTINANTTILRRKPAEGGLMAECLVRRRVEEDDFLEVR